MLETDEQCYVTAVSTSTERQGPLQHRNSDERTYTRGMPAVYDIGGPRPLGQHGQTEGYPSIGGVHQVIDVGSRPRAVHPRTTANRIVEESRTKAGLQPLYSLRAPKPESTQATPGQQQGGCLFQVKSPCGSHCHTGVRPTRNNVDWASTPIPIRSGFHVANRNPPSTKPTTGLNRWTEKPSAD
ncbi:uncharacterized protein EI90DRAFT_2601266 [Cantharellus anzutake]|uniref:uncharacterized protein n=1 Tax=Cantharellus anzutake TaxID=1750568 RepID=UPI001903FC3C|nr:uncharacterized protein EI90DRAFT_2601266 [Cantharellus anzutake]KAF8320559.1 hypothetical protein EI90DRAFT_2601266 [Cantharellus anzutake]